MTTSTGQNFESSNDDFVVDSTQAIITNRLGESQSDSRSIDTPAEPADQIGSSDQPSSDVGEADGVEDSLRASVVLLLGLTVGQKLIGFVRSIVICRWLDPVNMGLWGMSLALIETSLPLVLLSIPGCFGRYVEPFRNQGQLRGFFRQSATICLGLLLVGCTLFFVFRNSIAEFVYGDAIHAHFVIYCGLSLIPMALFAFCGELLVAIRQSRNSTWGHFIRGVSFTGIAIGLLAWSPNNTAMIGAFFFSYLIAMVFVVWKTLKAIREIEPDRELPPTIGSWKKLSGFIAAFWIADFMTNMFFTVDRYMLINLSTVNNHETLWRVGNYESAYIIPILIATVTALVAKILLPYQAKEWEQGNYDGVSRQINLTIKLTSLALFAGGLAVLVFGDAIFDVLFKGRYPRGSSVFPFAVVFNIGSGLTYVLMNFFWCSEKARWGTAATVVGVLCNIAVNAVLVPRLGIVGAAQATLVAIVVQVSLLLLFARRHGLRLHWASALMPLSALTLCVDLRLAGACLGAILFASFLGPFFTTEEKDAMLQLCKSGQQKIASVLNRSS